MLQKFIFFLIIDIIVLVCLLDHDFKHNERLGSISIFLCCQLYNFSLGFHSYLIWLMSIWCRLFFPIFNNVYIFYISLVIMLLLVILLLLVPINYFSKRKIKINFFIYIVITIAVFALGIVTFWFNRNNLDYI